MTARRRVGFAIAAGLLLAFASTVAVITYLAPTARRCSVVESVPSCGQWWGLSQNVPNATLPGAVNAQELASSRRLDIVHTYHRWFDAFPTDAERRIAAGGRLLFVNWEPTDADGNPMSWAAIAQGTYDTQIDALAAKLVAMPPVLLTFSHEPEAHYGSHGDAAAFVAAFRHINDRITAAGATSVRYVWNVEGLTDPVWLARYASFWPGAAYVDWIAWDPYNWAGCRTGRAWQSFSQTVKPFYDWLEREGYGGKPFMLAEYGSVEKAGDPHAKATWLSEIPAALTSMPNLRALVYFDVAAPPANCDWQVTTSTAATTAFSELARSAPFRPSARLTPTG